MCSLSEDQQGLGTTAELFPLEYYKNITFVGILGKIKYAIFEFRKKKSIFWTSIEKFKVQYHFITFCTHLIQETIHIQAHIQLN